jgi:hypothetical protein
MFCLTFIWLTRVNLNSHLKAFSNFSICWLELCFYYFQQASVWTCSVSFEQLRTPLHLITLTKILDDVKEVHSKVGLVLFCPFWFRYRQWNSCHRKCFAFLWNVMEQSGIVGLCYDCHISYWLCARLLCSRINLTGAISFNYSLWWISGSVQDERCCFLWRQLSADIVELISFRPNDDGRLKEGIWKKWRDCGCSWRSSYSS